MHRPPERLYFLLFPVVSYYFYSANILAECDQFSADCAQLEVRAEHNLDTARLRLFLIVVSF